MNKIIEKNRWLLIVLLLVLIFLLIIFFRFGFVLNFWLSLALWLVFGGIYYFWRQTSCILWIIFVVVFVFNLMVAINIFPGLKIVKSSTGKSGSASSLVSCTSKASDQPQSISGYTSSMYSQTMSGNSIVDNGIRTFSLAELRGKSVGSDIYYRLAKEPQGPMVGIKGLIEVCDNATNKSLSSGTTKDSTTTPGGENTWGMIYYMHGGNYPHGTGDYRIDAYANVSGSWVLVNRMTGITITD